MNINIQPVTPYEPVVRVTGTDGHAEERSHQTESALGEQAKVLSKKQVHEVVQELNTAMQLVGTNLSFSIDEATRKTVVKVLDAKTHEVIRQIPPEDMLRVSRRIAELLGVLFDHAA